MVMLETVRTLIYNMVYPIGSIYSNASDSTNPGTLLGFGTWEAFGAGRVLVGKAAAGTFNTAGATGGAETHTLQVTEIPAHHHQGNKVTVCTAHTGATTGNVANDASGTDWNTSDTGGGAAHNNLQPYVVVYIWKRTA